MDKYNDLLERVTSRVQQRMNELSEEGEYVTGAKFEDIVHDALIAEGIFNDKITHSTQRFPDFIIADENTKIGIEVKKTDLNKWEFRGGSIYESLKNKIEETYVLAGKFGDTPEARFKKYSECLSDLSVTHSPRFELNLDLPEGEDYLTKKCALDLLDMKRGPELDKRIRELLRTDKSTWYSEDAVISFSELSGEERLRYLIDGVVLFPEVTDSDYSNFAPWMIYKCLVWCSNVRDVFSAGGVVKYSNLIVSGVMHRMLKNADLIINRIEKMTDEEIKRHWFQNKENVSLEDISLDKRIEIWIGLIEHNLSISERVIKANKKSFPKLFRYKKKEDYEDIIVSEFIKSLRNRIESVRREKGVV